MVTNFLSQSLFKELFQQKTRYQGITPRQTNKVKQRLIVS